MEMPDQQVHWAGVAEALGIHPASMPLAHPRPPYETLGNGDGSPHLCYPLGFAQTSQETRAFSMLRNYLIP